MAEAIISLTEVTKKFREQVAVDRVSLELEKGKIHGVIGRNGSGKTVLMKMICGLYRPSAGAILVRGKRVGAEVEFPCDMGIIIETPGFLSFYSGRKNLRILAELTGKASKEKIDETMRLVGLAPEARKHVGKYSLGMRQRLGIAQAIMEEPDILLLDEPMNGLDNRGVEDIRRLFKLLRDQGKTILLASHNMLDIENLCDTVHEMDAGRIT